MFCVFLNTNKCASLILIKRYGGQILQKENRTAATHMIVSDRVVSLQILLTEQNLKYESSEYFLNVFIVELV